MKPLLLPLTAMLAVCLIGCSKPSNDETSASPPTAGTVGQAAIKNAPDGNAAPGAGYRIQPANPNDPKFKADPRLAGGG